jgi:hypothetical protein
MNKNKKVIIITIFAITSLLAGLSIYVSYELQKDYSPDDSAAQEEPTDTPTEPQPTKAEPTSAPPTKVPPTVAAGPTATPRPALPTKSTVKATPVPSGPLPQTALIDDRLDALLIGGFMVIAGIILYKKYLNFGDKETNS